MSQYPFTINVIVQRRAYLRDPNLEMVSYLGVDVLRQIFDEMRIDPDIKIVQLFYPERWMNITEERCLYSRLEKYCPNLKHLNITTQSVHIMSSTTKGSLRIACSEDEIRRIEESGGKLIQESVDGRLWYENVPFDLSWGIQTNT